MKFVYLRYLNYIFHLGVHWFYSYPWVGVVHWGQASSPRLF